MGSELLNQLRMQVNPENVLAVRKVLLTEAEDFVRFIKLRDRDLHVDLCGGDPVSPLAAEGFNMKIDALMAQVYVYVDGLKAAGESLAQTARDYGITEQQIAASFRSQQP